MTEIKTARFLLSTDAKVVFGKDKASISKWVKAGKIVSEEMQLYVKKGKRYYPLGDKKMVVIDIDGSQKLLSGNKKE